MPGERSVGRATPSFWYTAAEIKTSADGALFSRRIGRPAEIRILLFTNSCLSASAASFRLREG